MLALLGRRNQWRLASSVYRYCSGTPTQDTETASTPPPSTSTESPDLESLQEVRSIGAAPTEGERELREKFAQQNQQAAPLFPQSALAQETQVAGEGEGDGPSTVPSEEIITGLGGVVQEGGEEEVITFLGEGGPDAAVGETVQIQQDVVLAENMVDRLLPKNKKKLKEPRPDPVDVKQALEKVKTNAKMKRRKFEETVEVHLALLADPRRGDQLVRGTTVLPHGTGKQQRVCVFAEGEAAQAAKDAGADLVGSAELAQEILQTKGGALKDIDKCIATPDMMKHLGKLGRLLGPKGLMPNPKLGTLTTNVVQAVQEMKKGRVEFRADRGGVVHCGIGKVGFEFDKLYENFSVMASAIMDARPKGLRGSGIAGYVKSISVTSTMGKGVPVAPASFFEVAKEKMQQAQ